MSEMLTPLSDSRHTKAGGKLTPQICRSRIFVPANECARVVPMYPSQSAMSHLHSLARSVYVATFLPKHVITTCFADYVTSTSGAIRLAFDLLPLASSFLCFALELTDLEVRNLRLEERCIHLLHLQYLSVHVGPNIFPVEAAHLSRQLGGFRKCLEHTAVQLHGMLLVAVCSHRDNAHYSTQKHIDIGFCTELKISKKNLV